MAGFTIGGMPASRDPDLAFASTRGRWLLAVAVLGSGITFLDSTVVNVALPDIGRDLGASTSSLQWIVNGYMLTLASLILLGGSLGDRYGRRRVFILGTGLFTVASGLCAAAPNAELLIAARLLQGVGGALLTPGSLALIEASFRPGDRARAIGAWSGLGGVLALVLFFVGERRGANPMLPLGIVSSRQFSAANAVTFVVYAALGGFFFLLVAFLQISLGYSPIEAGSASIGL